MHPNRATACLQILDTRRAAAENHGMVLDEPLSRRSTLALVATGAVMTCCKAPVGAATGGGGLSQIL
jgi:hypothetical protein